MKTEKSSSKKIEKLINLLEHARRIQQSCKELDTHEEMTYFTNNIETYLEGIIGVIETDLKNILLTEFFNGNILIKQNNPDAPSIEFADVNQMVVNSIYSTHIHKLDEM